jgi:hypothetical protein
MFLMGISLVFDVKNITNNSMFNLSQIIKPESNSKYKKVNFEEKKIGNFLFYDPKLTNLIGGQLTQVHPSTQNQFLIPESKWFSPDHGQVGHYIKDVFENYKNYTEKAKRQAFKSKNEFSWDKMKDQIDNILTNFIPEFPQEVKLALPQLKKIELPKLQKING